MLNYLERVQSLAQLTEDLMAPPRRPRLSARPLRFEALDSRLMLDGSGDTIVTFNVTIAGQQESFQIELFNSLAPQTVKNFLSYIDSGEYNNTFVHRVTTDAYDGLSVVQGGGYSLSGAPFNGANQPTHISTSPTTTNFPAGLPNEYSSTEPNAPGTIAMALTGGSTGPNATSGTSEWFINVGDNSTTLAPSSAQNGVGYAVFGKVLGNGMQVVQQIQQMQRIEDVLQIPANQNNLGIFGPIPVSGFTTNSTSIDASNLVVINSITHPSIAGTIFGDVDHNGTQNGSEQGLAGWTAFLDTNNNGTLDSGDPTALTDANGNYSFTNLAAGSYTVRVQAPAGNWQATSSAAIPVTLTQGQSVAGQNFGEALSLATPGTPVIPPQYITGGVGSSLTSMHSIQLQVSGLAVGETVQLFDTVNNNSVLIASIVASGTSVTIPVTLAEGEHLIVASGTQYGFTSGTSAPRSVIVDSTPPQITSGTPATAAAGVAYSYQVTTNDQATFSLPVHPAGMAIDPNSGVVSWTPTGAQVGFQQFTVAATDLAGNVSQKTFTVGVSGPPVFTPIGDQTVSVGSTLKIVPSVSSINTPLTYSLAAGAPADAMFNTQTGEFDWAPTTAIAPGDYFITINVADSLGGTATSGPIKIVVAAPPVFTQIADQTIDEGESLSLPLSVTDQGQVTFSFVTPPPAGAAINFAGSTAGPGALVTNSGVFSWTPSEAQGPGVYAIAIKATDAGGLSTVEQFQITVNEVDTAPTIDPVAALSAKQGSSVSVTIVAHDVDLPAQTLVYSLGANAPAGAQINPQTGVLAWSVPTAYPTGQVQINVVVTEVGSQGLSAVVPVAVNVTSGTAGFTGFDLYTSSGVELGGYALGVANDAGFNINGSLSLSPFGSTQPGGLPASVAALQQLAGQIPVHAGAADVGARLPAGIVDVVLGFDSGVPHDFDGMELELARYGGSSGGGQSDQQDGEVQKAGNFETLDENGQRDPRRDAGQIQRLNTAPATQSSKLDFWGQPQARLSAYRAFASGQNFRTVRSDVPALVARGVPALPAKVASLSPQPATGRNPAGKQAAAAAMMMPLLVVQLADHQAPRRRLARWLDPLQTLGRG